MIILQFYKGVTVTIVNLYTFKHTIRRPTHCFYNFVD